ncbi:MAG TPA: hypothetical protein VIM26_26335 [Pengzhenrongella sp.]
MDTIGPAERSLIAIALIAIAVGALLGWTTQFAIRSTITAAVAVGSGVVACLAAGAVGLAQPCPGLDTCDIQAAPAAVTAGFAVFAAVAAACLVGFGAAFGLRSLLNRHSS